MNALNRCDRSVASLLLTGLLVAGPSTFAAGTHEGGHGHGPGIGKPGDARNVSRTIEVDMTEMGYEPGGISVKPGETVRFKVRNAGRLVHEFNIATAAMHLSHQEQMMAMVEHGVLLHDRIDTARMRQMDHGDGQMTHDHPNSVLLEPGESAELVWAFSEPSDIEFACNVPGHYLAGMVGEIRFE